ncbi:MAG: hypothetical protein AAGB22_08980, partial [Bacteroidota bacterium]
MKDKTMNDSKKKIGLFWGSDTGATDGVAAEVVKLLSASITIEPHEIYKIEPGAFDKYQFLILG